MNPASDTPAPNPDVHPSPEADIGRVPTHWREALLTLIASRIALFQLESKDFAKNNATRAACVVSMVICIFFTWALILAGTIAAISHASGLAWYWISLIAAAIHLVAALLFMRAIKAPRAAAFPVTRAEFHKDREWIENFQKTPKSNG